MPCYVAADVYRYRKSCDVGRGFLNVDVQRGDCSAEALGAYSERVYAVEHLLFKLCVDRVGIPLLKVAAERFFRKVRGVLEVAADPHADNYRGTWIASREADALGHEIHDILL